MPTFPARGSMSQNKLRIITYTKDNNFANAHKSRPKRTYTSTMLTQVLMLGHTYANTLPKTRT